VCGDGTIVGDEECDDDGLAAGDGCSATCAEEAGWNCAGEPSVCDTTCGDGIVVGDEECDDDGVANGDGCSSACLEEEGWNCTDEPSTCSPICGDGLLRGVEATDGGCGAGGCDDGDLDTGDGCDDTCRVEPDFDCDGEPSVCVAC
jgi:cysteine-rich repeat protein